MIQLQRQIENLDTRKSEMRCLEKMRVSGPKSDPDQINGTLARYKAVHRSKKTNEGPSSEKVDNHSKESKNSTHGQKKILDSKTATMKNSREARKKLNAPKSTSKTVRFPRCDACPERGTSTSGGNQLTAKRNKSKNSKRKSKAKKLLLPVKEFQKSCCICKKQSSRLNSRSQAKKGPNSSDKVIDRDKKLRSGKSKSSRQHSIKSSRDKRAYKHRRSSASEKSKQSLLKKSKSSRHPSKASNRSSKQDHQRLKNVYCSNRSKSGQNSLSRISCKDSRPKTRSKSVEKNGNSGRDVIKAQHSSRHEVKYPCSASSSKKPNANNSGILKNSVRINDTLNDKKTHMSGILPRNQSHESRNVNLNSENLPSDLASLCNIVELLPVEKSDKEKKCSQSARCVPLGNQDPDFARTLKTRYRTSRSPEKRTVLTLNKSPMLNSLRKSKTKIQQDISKLDEEIVEIGGDLSHQLERLRAKIEKNIRRRGIGPKGVRI